MVTFTITAVLQLAAIATIPIIVGVIAATQMNTKAKFQWKQGRIALFLSMIPAVIIFGLQGLLGPWMVLGSLAVVAMMTLLIYPDQN